MSRRTTDYCDACGAVKGEANKWWLLSVDRSGNSITVTPSAPDTETLESVDSPATFDACGEACMQAIFGQWVARAHPA